MESDILKVESKMEAVEAQIEATTNEEKDKLRKEDARAAKAAKR